MLRLRFRILYKYAYPLWNSITSRTSITIRVAGVEFSVGLESNDTRSYWSGGRFEYQEIDFIVEFSGPESVFFDIGANCGLFIVSRCEEVAHGQNFCVRTVF